MDQQLGVPPTLPEPRFSSSIHVGLKAICYSSSWGSNTRFLVSLGTRHICGVHQCRQTIKKVFFFLRKRNKNLAEFGRHVNNPSI